MNRRGMTLLEVTLALVLFGLLASFILGIINSVLGLWQAGERRGNGDLVFASASERLRADLSALHTGPDGWLVIDDWEAMPEADGKPAWRLPRLRFLADGGGLPDVDPTGRALVEVAWVLVPEDRASNRYSRLVRFARLDEGPGEGFEIDRVMDDTQAGGGGLVVLDGVLYASFVALGMDSEDDEDRYLDVPAQVPYAFPHGLRLEVERVSAGGRERPTSLDSELSPADGAPMVLRGSPPLEMPEYALIEEEWVRVAGNFPRMSAANRGLRGTIAAQHPSGTQVLLPEVDFSVHSTPDRGRRRR